MGSSRRLIGPYGLLGTLDIGPYGLLGTLDIGPYGYILVHIGPYGYILVHIGPYGHPGALPRAIWPSRDPT